MDPDPKHCYVGSTMCKLYNVRTVQFFLKFRYHGATFFKVLNSWLVLLASLFLSSESVTDPFPNSLWANENPEVDVACRVPDKKLCQDLNQRHTKRSNYRIRNPRARTINMKRSPLPIEEGRAASKSHH
jgi:hypothetical protein